MTHIQHTELTQVAANFAELMGSVFERPFELRDFFLYAQSQLGREINEFELEEVAFKYSGNYDLVRWDIGVGWALFPEL